MASDKVRDKLLDNNAISILVSDKDSRRESAKAHLLASAPARILLPAIAVAEIESGMAKVVNPAAEPQRQRVRQFFTRYPVLPFDFDTIQRYALLRAKLWHICGKPKPSGRGHVQKLPEELCDPASGQQLGIDERDLQIVSIALQYDLMLATFDRNAGMLMIERAAAELKADGQDIDLKIDDWTKPP